MKTLQLFRERKWPTMKQLLIGMNQFFLPSILIGGVLLMYAGKKEDYTIWDLFTKEISSSLKLAEISD